ncbi:UNVERIFIED_CONTAM: hypothetical protein K2H54_066456 [Gekko kuhli]
MRRAMEASSGAVVDLTHEVSLLVDTIRLQVHQPLPAVQTVSTAEGSQTGAIPSSREGPAGNRGHGPLAMGASMAAAGPQCGTAARAPTGGPGEKSAVPADRGVAGPEHRQPGTAPMANGAPERAAQPSIEAPAPWVPSTDPLLYQWHPVVPRFNGQLLRDERMRMAAHLHDRIPPGGSGRDIAGAGHPTEWNEDPRFARHCPASLPIFSQRPQPRSDTASDRRSRLSPQNARPRLALPRAGQRCICTLGGGGCHHGNFTLAPGAPAG